MNPHPKASKVIICGAARNVEKKLDKHFEVMAKSFVNFAITKFIVCEGYSSDNTREKLLQLQTNGLDIEVIDQPKDSNINDLRTVRIASARSAIQAKIRNDFSDFDYVVMADMDGVNRDLTSSAVESCWSYSNWHAVFANQGYKYYDIWALRAENWCEEDCWEEFIKSQDNLGHRRALRVAVTSKMKRIKRRSSPIKVDSAFGGLGIYKLDYFLNGTYSGVNENGKEVCEHVEFHLNSKTNNSQLFIMPNLINLSMSSQLINSVKKFLSLIQKSRNTHKVLRTFGF